jgi:hypothetical protein
MFRSLMTIIRELYLCLSKVTFMLKTLCKITSLYKLGDVAARCRAACVLCAVQSEYLTCRSDINDYFNVNAKLLTKLINSAFVGE